MKLENIEIGDTDCIKVPIPENYGDCLNLIISDRYRLTGKDVSIINVLFYILTHPLSLSVWLRLCAYKGFMYYPFRLVYRLCCNLRQIDIPTDTKIGYGLYLGHKRCIIINGGTIIGNNVNLSQFLNIGTNHNTPAIIGDNVYIGPNVCIVENVRIGSNSTIGAGAVVTTDIPFNSTCAGVPAKVLNFHNPGRYIMRRWINSCR